MTPSAFTLTRTPFAWGLLIFDLLLVWIAGYIHFGNLFLGVIYVAGSILTLLVTSSWLIIYYRGFFRTWLGWTASLLPVTLSSLVVQKVLPVRYPPASFFFTTLFIVSIWGVGLTTGILLWYRDVGLRLIAWGSVILVWMMAVAWRIQGNLIQLAFMYFNHPPDQPPPLWWFNTLLLMMFWMVPLGVVSFIRHTRRLVRREWRGEERGR